jgi:vancomycin resistance protein YoaR
MKRSACALLTVAVLAGCGGDSHESLAADSVATMKELIATLETVKDAASAKAAKPKLTAVVQKMQKIQERQTKLGVPSDADLKAMESTLGKEIEGLQQKMVTAMMRIQFDPAIQAELGDIDMKGMK